MKESTNDQTYDAFTFLISNSLSDHIVSLTHLLPFAANLFSSVNILIFIAIFLIFPPMVFLG